MSNFLSTERSGPFPERRIDPGRDDPDSSFSQISPAQIRSARAMLGWSMMDLAKAARVSISTVKRLEDGRSDSVTGATARMIHDALEASGVQFIPDDGIRRSRSITVDVAEGKQERFAGGDGFFVTEDDDRTVNALERATKHVLAARQTLGELDPDIAAQLRSATDALLIEIACHIAGTMVPEKPSWTEE